MVHVHCPSLPSASSSKFPGVVNKVITKSLINDEPVMVFDFMRAIISYTLMLYIRANKKKLTAYNPAIFQCVLTVPSFTALLHTPSAPLEPTLYNCLTTLMQCKLRSGGELGTLGPFFQP